MNKGEIVESASQAGEAARIAAVSVDGALM